MLLHYSPWLAMIACGLLTLLSIKLINPSSLLQTTTKAKSSRSQSRKEPGVSFIASPVQVLGVPAENSELAKLKRLFYKLHNLEHFPDVLAEARTTLLRFFAESLTTAFDKCPDGILSIKEFDENRLFAFIKAETDKIGQLWSDYTARRQQNAPREMFEDRNIAISWIKTQAPVKLVDGAWLGHIHRFAAPFSTRSITKNAWQVMSEELGDGDLERNHVYLYRKLLKTVGIALPNADEEDFIHPRHGLNDLSVWKAATAQLLISLFPHEFLPEILGFNMHFELLTWETICATRELRELDIDEYYFLLHVSIDNAHSGHTAMATKIVVDYLNYILRTEGLSSADQAWKRVQAGYLLSACTADASSPAAGRTDVRNNYAAETAQIFQAKALVSQKLHCASNVKVGGRKLVEWLDPLAMQSTKWAYEFLEALSEASLWIKPGESDKSRLVKALSWNGKMFGAFSDKELRVLRLWIDSLVEDTTDANIYWDFVQRKASSLPDLTAQNQNILVHYPVLDIRIDPHLTQWLNSYPRSTSWTAAVVRIGRLTNIDRLIAIWFAQISLLEATLSIPIKTCNKAHSALVRVVRAQRGFRDSEGCAGMDETFRTDTIGLRELGIILMTEAGLEEPGSLQQIIDQRPEVAGIALSMMHLAMRPGHYCNELVGMSWAFALLHEAFGGSNRLPPRGMAALREIAVIERRDLQVYIEEMVRTTEEKTAWSRGFEAAKEEIELCFR